MPAVTSVRRVVALLWRWLPLILWMALIYWLSDQPVLPHPVRQYGISDFVYDSAAHGFTFGMLALLAYRALPGDGWRRLTWAAVFALAYGASDEWHQSFVPGRTATLADWAMDTLGVGGGHRGAVSVGALWRAALGGPETPSAGPLAAALSPAGLAGRIVAFSAAGRTGPGSAQCRGQAIQVGIVQVAPLSRRQALQGDRADGHADQTEGGVADGSGHVAQLPFATLSQHHLQPGGGNLATLSDRRVSRRHYTGSASSRVTSAGIVRSPLTITPWRRASSAASSGTPSTCTR